MKREEATAGRFIQKDLCRLRIIGDSFTGGVVVQEHDECLWVITQRFEDWTLLPPECDSFDWQPETFPQYWTTVDSSTPYGVVFVIRHSKHDWRAVYRDGEGANIDTVSKFDSTGRKRLTEAEALAMLDKPEPVESIPEGVYFSPSDLNFYKEETNRGMGNDFYVRWKSRAKEFPQKAPGPVKSPDDWVTQDRVPARPGIDEFRWVHNGTTYEWVSIESNHPHVHGVDGCELRCRRKDLPPLPEPEPVKPSTRKVVLTEWYCSDNNGASYVPWSENPPEGWDHCLAISTREIEVPL